MSQQYTAIDDISKIHAALKSTFDSGVTLPLSYRRTQLLQLARLTQQNADAIMEAVRSDLGRPKLEVTLPEVGPIVAGSVIAAQALEEWAKPEKPAVEAWRSSWNTTIFKAPKGVVTIIGAWNYPFCVTLIPLIGAIAAGCTCVIKPSEHAPASAKLLTELIPKYLDPAAYAVVNGGPWETTRLLELKWNHIFYTGSTRVGRIVAAAAAKYVTPVTLELGGKSPVYVDTTVDVKIAARRILWGKLQNVGQLCVSPDHVYVPRSKQAELVQAFKEVYEEFWPKGALDASSTLSRMVSPAHHARVKALLARTKGKIETGGNFEGESRIEPTVVSGVSLDDSLMEEELFGPLLPLIPVDNVDQAIGFIKDGPTPLVLYVFTEDEAIKELFVNKTQSGSLIFNETFTQLGIHEMPFGGQGESGYGSYLGKYSFNTFTHFRSSIDVPKEFEEHLKLRYPPYTEEAFQVFAANANQPIPEA